MKSPCFRKRGFSLIELLFTVALFTIGVAGTMDGYLLASQRLYYLTCSQAASNSASQKLEQVRSAKWDIFAYPVVDEVVITNFPTQIVLLDIPVSGSNAMFATNYIEIKSINLGLKLVKVNCVWPMPNRKLFTNFLETYISIE